MRTLCVLLAVVGMSIGAAAYGLSAHAVADGPVPTLTGEQFHVSGNPPPVRCTTTGDFTYTSSGDATGPYPGSFTESAQGTVSQSSSGYVLSAFTATFTVTSASGAVEVVGTKTLDPTAGPSPACRNIGPVGQIQVGLSALTRYAATIYTPGGNYVDQGSSKVAATSPSGFAVLFETYTSSYPAAGPTSKDQCKDGGWRNFPQFKNQGDCVSFVATGGRH